MPDITIPKGMLISVFHWTASDFFKGKKAKEHERKCENTYTGNFTIHKGCVTHDYTTPDGDIFRIALTNEEFEKLKNGGFVHE